MLVKKETLGWSVNNREYRLTSKPVVIIFYIIDNIFDKLLFIRRKNLKIIPKEILVIRLEHLGDMVLTSIFISNLRRNYPKSKITLLCRKSSKEIAEMIEGVDEIIPINVPWSSRDRRDSYLDLLKFIFRNFRKYDLAFDLFFEFRNMTLMWFLSKFRVGSGIRGFRFLLNKEIKWDKLEKHIVSRQLDMLRSLNLKVEEKNTPLKIDKDILNSVKSKLKTLNVKDSKYTVVQLSTGLAIKDLPIEKWVEVVDNLVKNRKVVCADIDKRKVEFLRTKVKSENLVITDLNLKEYIHLIYNCDEVYSADSLAIHIASSFRKKLKGFYSGVNLYYEWGPYKNPNSRISFDKSCIHYPCGLSKCVFGYPSDCMKKLD